MCLSPPSIHIVDDLPPEDAAMLQALYSRNSQSVTTHLEKVRAGSGSFMERYYVGFGHKSIGDGASTTIFLEGVPMLATKALQDNRLYSGTECSTRYLNYTDKPANDPVGTKESREILERWMAFYITAQPTLVSHLKDKYPQRPGEKDGVYTNAILARCYDILRGFLPAGGTTNVAWHTNLRQAADKLATMRHHPDPNIAALAEQILGALSERYPHSFGHKTYAETERYRAEAARHFTYLKPDRWPTMDVTSKINPLELDEYRTLVRDRPPKTDLPPFLEELGHVRAEFLLDFASFRNLQRHRSGIIRMPLVTPEWGFHNWYYDQLPDDLRAQAKDLVEQQTNAIRALPCNLVTRQYYVAMGYRVPVRMTFGLPGLVYTLELRTGTTVHPTLRDRMQLVAKHVARLHPNVALHADFNPDDWDIRRGTQTITER